MATVNDPEIQNEIPSEVIHPNIVNNDTSTLNTADINKDKGYDNTQSFEEKELEEKQIEEIIDININVSTDEMIKNNIISRLNQPKTPESDGDDIKRQFHNDTNTQYPFQYNPLNKVLTEIDEIESIFNDCTTESTNFAETLISNVEKGYDEVIQHIAQRKEILLTEIASISKENEDNLQSIVIDFMSFKSKMMAFKHEIDTLTSNEEHDEAQTVSAKAMEHYDGRNIQRFDGNHISDLVQSSKLLRLTLFLDTNNVKNCMNQQFKLVSNTNKNKENEEFEAHKAQREHYPEYVDDSYYNHYNENKRYYDDEYYVYYDDNDNDGRRRRGRGRRRRNKTRGYRGRARARARGSRSRGSYRGRRGSTSRSRSHKRSYNMKRYSSQSMRGNWRRYNINNYDNEQETHETQILPRSRDGYVFNDYIPTPTAAPATAPATAPAPAPATAPAEDWRSPIRTRERDRQRTTVYTENADETCDSNDNNGSIGNNNEDDEEESLLNTERRMTLGFAKKQWTVKHKDDDDNDEGGGDRVNDDDNADGFRSNTHHIFVRDTETLDFSSIQQQYRDIVIICQFSDEYYSKNGLILSKNRTVLQRIENQKHGYAVLDCKHRVKEGQHCWRIKCKNFSPWVFIGVCKAYMEYSDTSWNNKNVWGISTCSQSNRNGHWSLDYSVKTPHWKNKKILQIDMMLDCDRGILKYKQTNANSHHNIIVLDGLHLNIQWIPHFNLHTTGSTISVKKIPHTRFGQIW